MTQRLRDLPKVDEVLGRAEVRATDLPRWAVVAAVRAEVDARRQDILAGRSEDVAVTAGEVLRRARRLALPSLRRVINATGVVLHTNLGRAPLPMRALQAIDELCRGYSNLEYDLSRGARGSRHGHVAEAVCSLTGAQDAVCVNNNAAAVMLCLAAVAYGKEVIVSRGELVEIGGSFRIPDVMRLSGATLVEVGTTNRTRVADYEAAITDNTGCLLKVHRSNFKIVGFTEEVSPEQLAQLGERTGIPSVMDLGSGAVWESADWIRCGLPGELSARAVLSAGVNLVTFSGDKLLGGPQAGLIAGHKEAVAKARSHPLMRALRPDKMTIAALEATLTAYRDGDVESVPALQMLSAPLDTIRQRADVLVEMLGTDSTVSAETRSCASAVGGGAMPGTEIPSWGVALGVAGHSVPARRIERQLLDSDPPVVARIIDDVVILDMRTVTGDLLPELANIVSGLRNLV